MTIYYVICNDQLVATIDLEATGALAFPLIRGADTLSLMDSRHAANLMANLSLTAPQALAALGIADLRASVVKAIFVAPTVIVGLQTQLAGAVYHLVDFGAYSLWQVDAQADNIIALHNELYGMAPASTLGALAVVQTFGTAFYPTAVMATVGMTAAQALARRNRIATYLDSLGKSSTALRAATTEHTQILAIVAALGYTTAQLWGAMTA
jgi:hypothetical protein